MCETYTVTDKEKQTQDFTEYQADNGVLSFEVDVLYTDVSDDVSCDGLAILVIDEEQEQPETCIRD